MSGSSSESGGSYGDSAVGELSATRSRRVCAVSEGSVFGIAEYYYLGVVEYPNEYQAKGGYDRVKVHGEEESV
jgi:hypothetical protein